MLCIYDVLSLFIFKNNSLTLIPQHYSLTLFISA